MLAGIATVALTFALAGTVLAGERRTAFQFRYPDVNPRSESHGQEIALSDLVAREGLVLNFIASWCPPCWQEIPAFVKLEQQVTTPVVFIAADEHDGPEALLARLERVDTVLPVLLVPPKDIATFEQHYDHSMLPTTYMVDREGTILQRFEGMLAENTLFQVQQKHFPESGNGDLPEATAQRKEGAIKM